MFEIDKLNKAKEGDLKSIEEICADTWEPLYKYIYYKVQNREEAEDITQEAYVKAFSYTQRSGITPDKYIAFLKTVALNILRDRWRKNKSHGSAINIELIAPSEAAEDDPTEASTERMIIEDALEKLNEEQRTVIELRIIKGFSVAETAKIMNKNEVTVRVLQHRTLKVLSKII